MVSAINSAISGLNAASKRLENSANNLANQFSTTTILNGQTSDTPYVPTDVQQVSLQTGGVATVTTPRSDATTPAYDPNNPQADANGIVNYPNVDTAQELVATQIASYDYKANLKSIKAADDLQKKLLDIIT